MTQSLALRAALAALMLAAAWNSALAQFGSHQMFHHWYLRPADSPEDWGRVEVPGNLHLDLYQLGRIPHPFAGTAEDSLQWIGQRDWSYRSHLHVSDTLLASGHPEMVFEGLDTYADIYLNGVLLQRTDNMFRRWVIPVEGLLLPGHNTVEVLFRATGPREAAMRERSGISFPGGDRVFTRKAQYHYGWDWGPDYRTAGIYKNAYLRTWNKARLLDAHYRLDSLVANADSRYPRRSVSPSTGWNQEPFEPDTAYLTAVLELEADGVHQLLLKLGGELPEHAMAYVSVEGRQIVEIPFVLPKPALWWSRGLGPAHRYRTRALLEDATTGLPLDHQVGHTGLRIIELVREPDPPAPGVPEGAESFAFRLNGVPVYAKGANWIPTSSFVFGYVPDYLRLLRDAERSNFNMLRVWGGGIYELDVFYDYCSRAGILVWQDFMFACAMYPGEATGLPAFTDNVRQEAAQQIRRLRRYPALALWCGNNEIAEAWERWGWQPRYSPEERKRLEADYRSLFEDMLPGLVARLSPEVAYWPSSPSFGRGDPRYLSRGNAHDWWVWHDNKPFEVLEQRVPRFMSEFGFQAYPDLRTLEHWRGSPMPHFDTADAFLLAHQKHPRGAAVIDRYLRDAFGRRLPDSMARYTYLSQWLQADGIGRGLEAQRRARPWCMGSLYWQFNDVWPSVSWSGIDVDGRWKALQYRARRAFADWMVSTYQDSSGTWRTVLVSDRREAAGALWELSVWTTAGERLHHLTAFADVPGLEATELWSGSATDWPGLARPDVVVHALVREMGQVVSEHFWYPGRPADWPGSADPGLVWKVEPLANAGFRVRIRADKPVRGLWLSTSEEGWFSDNGFDLVPGREVQLNWEPAGAGLPGYVVPEPQDPARWEQNLNLMHLGQSWPR